MTNHEIFLEAIKAKKLVSVSFQAEEKGSIERICVPFDFGPSRRNMSPNPDRYHFYDLNSPDGKHTLSILPEKIIEIKATEQEFDPAEHVKWTPNWFVARDWGVYS